MGTAVFFHGVPVWRSVSPFGKGQPDRAALPPAPAPRRNETASPTTRLSVARVPCATAVTQSRRVPRLIEGRRPPQ